MKTLVLVPLALLAPIASAQNLVPNPSFEEHSSCPAALNDMGALTDWFDVRGTCDFFHVCGTAIDTTTVPVNLAGYQEPSTGEGYLGLYGFSDDDGNPYYYREWAAVRLMVPTVQGQQYFVSFRVSLALWENYPGAPLQYASNRLGVRLTNDTTAQSDFDPVPNDAHFSSLTIVTDTTGWTTIAGSLIADSVYQFLLLGNFYDDTQTDAIVMNPNSSWDASYYYVDDVCLALAPGDCQFGMGTNQLLSNELKVYPNPFIDEVNIRCDPVKGEEPIIELFDALGRSISFAVDAMDYGYRLRFTQPLTHGAYALVLTFRRKAITHSLIH